MAGVSNSDSQGPPVDATALVQRLMNYEQLEPHEQAMLDALEEWEQKGFPGAREVVGFYGASWDLFGDEHPVRALGYDSIDAFARALIAGDESACKLYQDTQNALQF